MLTSWVVRQEVEAAQARFKVAFHSHFLLFGGICIMMFLLCATVSYLRLPSKGRMLFIPFFLFLSLSFNLKYMLYVERWAPCEPPLLKKPELRNVHFPPLNVAILSCILRRPFCPADYCQCKCIRVLRAKFGHYCFRKLFRLAAALITRLLWAFQGSKKETCWK